MKQALAFIPLGDVAHYFESLEADFPPEAEEVLTYFETYYIGSLRANGTRKTPLFRHEWWNAHTRTANGEHRMNNIQEGGHSQFSAEVNCHHPTLWKLIENIRNEQQSTEENLERMHAGQDGPTRKERYRKVDQRLRSAVTTFEQCPPLEFLRGIAHNLAFFVEL